MDINIGIDLKNREQFRKMRLGRGDFLISAASRTCPRPSTFLRSHSFRAGAQPWRAHHQIPASPAAPV